jgi:IS5 family transposase
MEFQVSDQHSSVEFVENGFMSESSDANTVAFARERLRKAGIIEELFERFEGYLRELGLEGCGGQITIDETVVPVPKQRNRRVEKKENKAELFPDGWGENSHRLQQNT